ncbi:Starch-binding associating with outer membrane [Niastella yeongjuensis]|nr:SusD/RagB family nutrient-binding outer membrane lipoprotein [Niastella yeongjuensis]SEN22540.1 Starch-binding associating with outer membrane [Niastella yeongjuensis]
MKKLLSIQLVVALLITGTGCTKFSDDINVDPNAPSKASNAQLLTYSISQMANVIESVSGLLYVQHWSEKPYTDNSRYTVVNFDFYDIYTQPLQNLQTILNARNFDINEGSVNNQKAVARILKAWFFWHMTDRWGDIPYFNALKGKDNFSAGYDKQKDIYYDLMKELKEAAAQIDNGNKVVGDLLYTDMASWKRFANSMRLLMALRLSKADPAKGKAEFLDALNSGVFTDNSQNAVYIHLADAANQSYWYYVANVQNDR